MKKEIASYQSAKIKHFQGLLVICVNFTGLSFLVIILEILSKKQSSKNVTVWRHGQTKHIRINREELRRTYLRISSGDLLDHQNVGHKSIKRERRPLSH